MVRPHLTSVDDPAFDADRRRLALPSSRDRWTRAAWLVALGAALMPLITVAQVQLTYLAVPAVIALSSRWLTRTARWATLLGTGALAGLGAAGVPPSTLLMWVFAAFAIAVALADGPRATRAAVVIVVAITVALVHRVLDRAGWPDEAHAVTQLATGCFAGIVAAMALLWLTRPREESKAAPPHVFALIVGACAAAGAARIVVERQPAVFPRWMPRASGLTAAAPNPSAPSLVELHRLQNAGFRDAGLARAGVLLVRGADVTALKSACLIGYRAGQLAPTWSERVALGETACNAVAAFPEDGALAVKREEARTHGADRAALARLRGDLLMEAGRIEQALEAYGEARTLGELNAPSDAVRALLDRGRIDEARAFAARQPTSDVVHARLALWLAEPLAAADGTARLTEAWNDLLDFSSLVPLSRRGAVVSGEGRALSMVDAEVGRESLTAVSEDLASFGVALPLPPGRVVPAALDLDIRARPAFRLDLTTVAGQRVVFSCGLAAGENDVFIDLGEECGTTPTHIEPRRFINGELASMELVGGYSAYALRLPEEAAP